MQHKHLLLELLAFLPLARAPTVAIRSLATQLTSVVERMCASTRATPYEKQACIDASRFQAALNEAGHRLSPAEDDPWRVLEGDALKRHPDPLGALQRGEVPAVMLRRFVPAEELDKMLSRMAAMTVRMFTCRFRADNVTAGAFRSAKRMRALRITSNDSVCVALNRHAQTATLTWPHWCALLSHVEHDCATAGAGRRVPECGLFSSNHPVFERCRYDYGHIRKKTFVRLRTDRVVKLAAREFGQKLYGNLFPKSREKFMGGAAAINALHEMMAAGCTGRYCSPKHAMLAGVAELAGPSRPTRQAEEDGEAHSPGTIRAMTNGWSTPLHMDSKHSSAFAALRREMCGEDVSLSMKTSPAEASRFGALTRHRFAASAILTLHAPKRDENPSDLNVFRHRWPALLDNCSVRAIDAYGVGARFVRASMPPQVLENPLTVRADPGDLFLFNSEFFHDTPRIFGDSSRTVFNSFAGFSSDGGPVEVYA